MPAVRPVADLAQSLVFDRPVPPGGYAWWYLDALSDDGTEAITLIALVGSVFSPYYAWAGRKDPLNHVAMNVALYRRQGGRWALTERGRNDLTRTPDSLRIGRSALWQDGDAVQVELNETCWPMPRAVKGRVRLVPEIRGGKPLVLAPEGDHHWWPIAPRSRVEVEFDEPSVKWSGTGYLDSNWGSEPLEDAFHSWTWSRAPLARGAAVLYDVTPRRGPQRSMALKFDGSSAGPEPFEPPARVPLKTGLFGIERETRSEGDARLVRTLTDSHFYARSVVQSQLCGERVTGVHESLSLDRFGTWWAKLLLPVRMPRNAK